MRSNRRRPRRGRGINEVQALMNDRAFMWDLPYVLDHSVWDADELTAASKAGRGVVGVLKRWDDDRRRLEKAMGVMPGGDPWRTLNPYVPVSTHPSLGKGRTVRVAPHLKRTAGGGVTVVRGHRRARPGHH